jgi:hypothetical protein
MDPVDDAFNTILSALHDLRQRVAALERAQPAPAETPQADEPPGAVEYYLEWFNGCEDLGGLATAFKQFWRNGRSGLSDAEVQSVTKAKDARKQKLSEKAKEAA